MYQLIMIIHVLTAICLVALVLVQQGKGANMGAAFGSGASQTVFGSRGSGSFLLKITIGFILIFFATSLFLNRMVTTSVKQENQAQLPIPVQQNNMPMLPASE
jgi:preprotein translocase subunit SecG